MVIAMSLTALGSVGTYVVSRMYIVSAPCGIYSAVFPPSSATVCVLLALFVLSSAFALFDPSTVAGGVSLYHQLSGGEALWYTICALPGLLVLCARFAPVLRRCAATIFKCQCPVVPSRQGAHPFPSWSTPLGAGFYRCSNILSPFRDISAPCSPLYCCRSLTLDTP